MSTESPNRAMLLTAPGAAAIAVVRINGGNVKPFLDQHFSKKTVVGKPVHGEIRDGDRAIDDPVIVLLAETQADVCLHGGAWVVHAFLALAERNGFAIVDPTDGPLPAMAVAGDTEIAREVNSYLPLARTELALRVLLGQPTAWKNRHTFSVKQMLADRALHWLLHPPRVAIVGTANVGKSTLANQLFARQRVITADLPGTTRDWVGEIAEINGLAVLLVDTPGVRQTVDPLEREAIKLSKPVVEKADLVIVVLDPTQPMEPEQSALLRQFPDAIKVINKSDRGSLQISGAVQTIAVSGQGIDLLRRKIAAYFQCDEIEIDRPRIWTERQRMELATDEHR